MIFVDTGAWFAGMVADDANHPAAAAWLAQNKEPLITTDYVFSETVTLLLARRQRPQAEAFGKAILSGGLATLHVLDRSEIEASWDIFLRFSDKQWSFTDCTSKLIIETLKLEEAFSFDQHFKQFGSVRVVP